ncbi:MAG TPA: hypothetical protein VLK83_04185, partial [Rhodanobacteraceae bacterium]|nr:hypothetical protein [Rhodanobacteraceae bacterium]
MLTCLATASFAASAANPLTAIGETFSDWKDRLFGKPKPTVDAPAEGPVELQPGHLVRIHIDNAAPEREFPKGKSRYRVIDVPGEIAHAAIRVQITALPRDGAFGHEVFKPFLYTLNDDDSVRDTVEVKPLHLDIRPFRKTRLLGCTTLENAARFAIATEPDVVGKSYESEVRDAVKAPTQGGLAEVDAFLVGLEPRGRPRADHRDAARRLVWPPGFQTVSLHAQRRRQRARHDRGQAAA